jgi:hypothetical protein
MMSLGKMRWNMIEHPLSSSDDDDEDSCLSSTTHKQQMKSIKGNKITQKSTRKSLGSSNSVENLFNWKPSWSSSKSVSDIPAFVLDYTRLVPTAQEVKAHRRNSKA